jgi:hypothetical protein
MFSLEARSFQFNLTSAGPPLIIPHDGIRQNRYLDGHLAAAAEKTNFPSNAGVGDE